MKWTFNKEVAKNFDYIADTSIPKYRVIIHKTVDIIKNLRSDSQIIDVGCATGNTLDALKKHGFTNLFGVDSSRAMWNETRDKGYKNIFDSLTLPKGISFDVVIANWTLHFIEPEKRLEYISNIYNSMVDGGVLILSEKVNEDQTEYLKFKKSNFLTDEEIKAKEEALKGVLITRPIEWYMRALKLFKSVEIIDHTYCFVTFLVIK